MAITKGSLSRARFSPIGGWLAPEAAAPEAVAPEERGRTYRKLLDCQNEEVVETGNSGLVAEWRELKIRLNPQSATERDVVFLLLQLDEARAERQNSNYASATAIDVEAWLAANRRPPSAPDWIAALAQPYFPPV